MRDSLWRRLLGRALGWRMVSAGAGLLALGAIIGGLLLYGARADQRGDATEFNAREVPGGPSQLARRRGGAADPVAAWPMWGRGGRRDRFLRSSSLRPPFVRRWSFAAHTLLEFPPTVGVDSLYLGANDGTVYALLKTTGKVVWRTRTPGPIASSPALHGGKLYQTVMDGKLYVLDAETGAIEWSWHAGSRLESSPIVVDGRIVFGSHEGKVFAIDPKRRRPAWTFTTDDAVKGAVAGHGRSVYVGTYGGNVYKLRTSDGSQVWRSQTRREFAFGGALYSTPAVAYGRVFVGSTDGRVYALGARTGKVLWVRSTGDWVYASPAIAHERVFVGSYDRWFYALDAKTGDIEWRFQADERISGSATVVGKVVYFSSMGGTTYALGTRAGKLVWTFADGRYSPVVSDGERLYLTGRTRQYGLVPGTPIGTGGGSVAATGDGLVTGEATPASSGTPAPTTPS